MKREKERRERETEEERQTDRQRDTECDRVRERESLHTGVGLALHAACLQVASIVSGAFMDIKEQEWSEMPAGHKDSYSWNLLWTWSKPKVSSGMLCCFALHGFYVKPCSGAMA